MWIGKIAAIILNIIIKRWKVIKGNDSISV